MKRLSVVLVCSSRGVWAGTEKWTLRTAEGLAARGYHVLLIVRDPDLWRPRMRKPVPLYRLPFANDWDLLTLLGLVRVLRGFDIVIPTRVRDYWLAGLAAKPARSRVLLRLGVVRRLRDNNFRDRLRYALLTDRILVNAEAIRTTLRETPWMQSTPINVIRNGVDLREPTSEEKHQELRRKLGMPLEVPIIVGAGRLAVEKRWDWLVEAVERLRSKFPQLQAYILGEGNERARLEVLIRQHNLETVVHLPGLQSPVEDWLQAADVVALPSSNEGLSNVMLEAMGAGVSVVCTASGGVREVFRDGRELFIADTDDFEGFTERLKMALADTAKRQQVAQHGYEAVQRDFTWNTMLDQLEALLVNITGETS